MKIINYSKNFYKLRNGIKKVTFIHLKNLNTLLFYYQTYSIYVYYSSAALVVSGI